MSIQLVKSIWIATIKTIQKQLHMKKNLFVTIFILFLGNTLSAQLDMSLEIRPRAEYRHGFKTLIPEEANAAMFIGQRSRLNLGFNDSSVKAFLSVQDIRTWGDVKTLSENVNSTSIHEAWAKIGLSNRIYLKIGRQEIAYDDQRIFGSVNWANQARSHDAAVFMLKDSLSETHIGLAFNQDGQGLTGRNYTTNNYKAFQYLWYKRKFNKTNLSFLLLNLGFQDLLESGISYQQTIGTNINVPLAGLGIHSAFYYQMGKTGGNHDIAAYNFALDAKYKIDDFTIIAGLEILSGNNDDLTDKEAFTPFFGTNHKFNGFMDYFFVGNHGNNVGLNDYYIKLKKKFKTVATGIDFHYFGSNTEISPTLDSNLGTEVDLYAAFPIRDAAKVKLGYSMMFATESMEILKGITSDRSNSWGYLMIIMKPGFSFTE